MSDFMRDRAEALSKENFQLKGRLREINDLAWMYRWASIILGVMFVVALMTPREVCAAEYPIVAKNWCSEFADGYYTGFCWKGHCEEEAVPPVMCPYPKGDEDPYTRGLKEGLKAGELYRQESL
jgi:hypothetical protein